MKRVLYKSCVSQLKLTERIKTRHVKIGGEVFPFSEAANSISPRLETSSIYVSQRFRVYYFP